MVKLLGGNITFQEMFRKINSCEPGTAQGGLPNELIKVNEIIGKRKLRINSLVLRIASYEFIPGANATHQARKLKLLNAIRAKALAGKSVNAVAPAPDETVSPIIPR
uniref:Uncharacterized protein n=1 Tax=Spongospora subterranea TaxID=70186 RepID=A0A0H5RSJ5_9EUKA|eukprot:CRZ11709.1 hypothetical protein [Spongospora subterranea]